VGVGLSLFCVATKWAIVGGGGFSVALGVGWGISVQAHRGWPGRSLMAGAGWGKRAANGRGGPACAGGRRAGARLNPDAASLRHNLWRRLVASA
jgi:hypothetical protein